MQSKQHMAICPTHAQTRNLLIKNQQKCTLVCANCILNSPNSSSYSLDTSTFKPFGLLVTEQSKMYFEQWTKQLIVYLQMLVQENNCHLKVINSVSIMPSVEIWREQLSKLMKTVLFQQMKIFEGNLGYVRRFNASQLTNQIFLADLYSMAVQSPELSLEIILDRFKFMARQSSNLASMYWQIQKLAFSQQFVSNVQKIKEEVIKRCQTNFIINIENQKRRNGQVSIINNNQQKEVKTEKKQNEIESEYEGQGTDEQNQLMRVSQIMQRKQVVGHQSQQGNSNRKLKVIGHKSLKASWEQKQANKGRQYCTPSRMKQKQNYFHKLQIQKRLVEGQERRTIPSTEQSRNNNSKYSSPENTKTVKSQHLTDYKEVREFANTNGTHNCNQKNCQKCTNIVISPIQKIAIELEDQNKKLLRLKRQLGQQIQSMRSKISQAYTVGHNPFEKVKQKYEFEPKIDQLQAKVGQLEARVNQLVTNKEKLEQQLDELKKHCSIKEDLCRLLEQKINAMQKEKNEMVAKMNNNSLKYKNELNQLNRESQFKLEQLEEQNCKLIIQIKKLEQQIIQWKQNQNVSVQRQMKLRHQLNELNDINQKFIEQICMKNKLIKQLENSNNEQIEQRLIDAEIERQKGKLLTTKIQEFQNQNRLLHQQNEELKIRIKEQEDLVSMIDQLKVVLLEKQTIISSTNNNFIELQTKCVNYQNSLEAIINSLQEKQNHIKDLSEKMVSIQKQLEQSKDIQAKYMGMLQSKQTLIEGKPKVELELSFEKFINQQLSQSTHDLSQKLKKLEMQLAVEKKNNDELVANLNSQNASSSQKIESLLKQNESLNAEKEAMTSELSEQQKDIINLNTNLSQLANKLQQLKQFECRLKQYEVLIDETSSLNQNLKLQLQIETKKTTQLQNIIQSLVSHSKEKQNELKSLRQQVINKNQMIEQQGKQLMDMRKLQEEAQQRQLQSKQYLERMVSKCQQLQKTISLFSQRVSELENNEHQAQRAQRTKGIEEEMERSKAELQKKIVYLEEKAKHLEQELKKQSDYDEQLMQQLIDCESKLKSKHFEVDKLSALCQQLMGEIDVEKRVKYEQMITKIKPSRLKTQ